jgi:hypothetical protein
MEQIPRIGDADLSTATTLEEFTLLLRRLHVRAGRPSYRDLEKWAAAQRLAGRDLWLNKSTLSDALTGKRLPTKGFVAAFVEACGIAADHHDLWMLAWERVAEHHHLLNPPVPQQRALRCPNCSIVTANSRHDMTN